MSWSSADLDFTGTFHPANLFLEICTETLKPPLLSEPQEIRNIHNDELMGIRREEEMEMSDEEIEDPSEMKETEESGKIPHNMFLFSSFSLAVGSDSCCSVTLSFFQSPSPLS